MHVGPLRPSLHAACEVHPPISPHLAIRYTQSYNAVRICCTPAYNGDGEGTGVKLRSGCSNRGRSTASSVRGVVGHSAVPESDRAASALPDADYADAFTSSTEAAGSPEQWARAMFGDIPSTTQRFIWRGLLGLRLCRGRSPHTVAGWRIAERGDRWIRLETCSWFMSAELVVRTSDGQVSVATFVRYERRLGSVVWPPLSAAHRLLIPRVLRSADKIRARDQSRPDVTHPRP